MVSFDLVSLGWSRWVAPYAGGSNAPSFTRHPAPGTRHPALADLHDVAVGVAPVAAQLLFFLILFVVVFVELGELRQERLDLGQRGLRVAEEAEMPLASGPGGWERRQLEGQLVGQGNLRLEHADVQLAGDDAGAHTVPFGGLDDLPGGHPGPGDGGLSVAFGGVYRDVRVREGEVHVRADAPPHGCVAVEIEGSHEPGQALVKSQFMGDGVPAGPGDAVDSSHCQHLG